MLKLRKMLKKNRKGFTLIELIVVIAILAIIALLAIPRFLGTLDNARLRTHNANVRTLQSAANVALAENGNPGSTITWPTQTTGDYAVGDYVDVWPENPGASGVASGDYSVSISNTGVVTVTPGIATLD